MTLSALSTDFAAHWTSDAPEARLLADALRHGRLSFLCGDAGAGKTSLLVAGLLPLLRRRASDGAIAKPRRGDSVVLPFPERRSAARSRLAEIVVFFDAWSDAPLSALHYAIDRALRAAGGEPEPDRATLPERVKGLADRDGTRILFVFDGFESLLESWRPAEPNALVDQLVQLLNRRLPAHVLIVMRSEALPLLLPFTARLFAADAEVLTLPHWRETEQPGTVESFADREDDRSPRAVPELPPPIEPPSSGWSWTLGFGALFFVVLALGLWAPQEWGTPDAPTPVATAPAIATPAASASPPLPIVDLQVDAEGGSMPRLPAELARALAGDPSGVDLHLRSVGPAESTGSHLSIVRYEALQAAAKQRFRPKRIAIVAPLYTEELYVVVRADSPWKSVRQIEGRRIDIGPAFGDRALTAQGVYQQMFGKNLPATQTAHLGAAAALAQLAEGDSLDAVMFVEPQPSATLSALPIATRQALKLLPLDRNQASSRRLFQAYLPATLRDASLAGSAATSTPIPTVSSMAFLVSDGTPDAAQTAALVRLVESMCRALPVLKRDGDAKWRQVQPGLQLDTGWPASPVTAGAWKRCADASPSPTASTTQPQGEQR